MPEPVPPPAPSSAKSPTPPDPDPEAAGTGAPLLDIETFAKLKLVTAEVVEARLHPKADRLLILQVQAGSRRKQIVSGIREYYSPEAMLGKTIILVDNLKPAKLRGEISEGMLLAVTLPDGGLRLLTTDGPAPSGLPVS